MRILVVEDDVTLATALHRGLTAEGYDVEVAHDGADGLARVRAGRFDLVVLDILLPAMNGYRVCGSIRADGNWTPILILTAKSGEYDEAEGLETGADDFLTKPFSMVVLQARVRALLRRPRVRDDARAPDGIHLDPLHRRCVRGDVAVALTARETEVLAHLLDRRGRTVGKAELLDAVWGPGFAGDPNIVEVYVGRLRRKLDAQLGWRTIETVRGAGYRLDAAATP